MDWSRTFLISDFLVSRQNVGKYLPGAQILRKQEWFRVWSLLFHHRQCWGWWSIPHKLEAVIVPFDLPYTLKRLVSVFKSLELEGKLQLLNKFGGLSSSIDHTCLTIYRHTTPLLLNTNCDGGVNNLTTHSCAWVCYFFCSYPTKIGAKFKTFTGPRSFQRQLFEIRLLF